MYPSLMRIPNTLRDVRARARRSIARVVDNRFGLVARISRRSPAHPDRTSPVSDTLLERIGDPSMVALSPKLTGEDRSFWAEMEPGSSKWKQTALHFSVHYSVEGAMRAGLTASAPPAEVHAMARGSRAAGGSFYHADMIFGALVAAGLSIPEGGRILDFGCSSGRVIRVIKAYRPDLDCYGCDPNEEAIHWAVENLRDIEFVVSPQHPPLPFVDGGLDCVFAVSIWSHFGSTAAVAWLAEMHRVLKTGGLLILTIHSFESIAHFTTRKLRSPDDMRIILASLLKSGFGYIPVFGQTGDWGVIDPEWGEAYISPEWLLSRATPQWEMALYRTGWDEDNHDQDVVILKKRDLTATPATVGLPQAIETISPSH